MTIEDVAKAVSVMRWETVPDGARRQAKLALLDTLGTMLGGVRTDFAVIAAHVARSEGGDGPARICATGVCTSRANAAFANAVAANALDFDDGHYLGGAIHPGAATIAALLATADGREITSTEFLTAQIAAYEVAIRMGYLLWPREPGVRNHTSGTSAAVGAAAGAAKLLGLDSDGIRRAMQIAWGHAPMAFTQFPMVKESLGWAAATGVMAAALSAAGFMGGPENKPSAAVRARRPPTPFDEARGSEEFVTSLGVKYETEATYFKQYATCRFTHAAADGFAEILTGRGLTAADVAHVTVGTHRWAVHLTDTEPTAVEYAQYSFPFHLGAVAVDGCAGPDQISERRLHDEGILRVARLVTVEHHDDLDRYFPGHYPARVEVVTHSGRKYSVERVNARGDPELPLSPDSLMAKFESLARPVLGPATAALAAKTWATVEGTKIAELWGVVTSTGLQVS